MCIATLCYAYAIQKAELSQVGSRALPHASACIGLVVLSVVHVLAELLRTLLDGSVVLDGRATLCYATLRYPFVQVARGHTQAR